MKILGLKLFYIVILLISTIGLANAAILVSDKVPLQHQFVKSDETYIISTKFDMNYSYLVVPQNCTLKFENGLLRRGRLIGNNTRIEATKDIIFEDIEISGVWNNRYVYSEWVGLKEGAENDNKVRFKNLMALCKGENHKDAYIHKGCFWTSVNENSCAFSIPSNTILHCSATICELPNDFEHACLILINKVSNVIIDGGNYVGDLKSHLGNDGEWSHGIEIRGASNITVNNVKCSYFWGDGIDIIEGFNSQMEPVYICKNITILNSDCLYNRRQGLSIEAVDRCLVKNCMFAFTGRYKHTPPSAGIDIEAWAKNIEKIKNIYIDNCIMKDNVGPSFQSCANVVFGKDYARYMNSILVVNCIMDDIAISHTNGIEFRKCIFDKIRYEKHSKSVMYTKCNMTNVIDWFSCNFRNINVENIKY